MPLKVSLLLDSLTIPVWQYQIIEYLRANSSFEIALIVINDAKVKPQNSNRFIYKILRKADRATFRSPNDNFKIVDSQRLLSGIKQLRVKTIAGKHTDEFQSNDLAMLKAENLDVILRFGFRILKGEILKISTYGVWSLHHGDNAVNRGGPPAFWEVVYRVPVTGVTLQILSHELDAGRVLDQSFIQTNQTSFNRNQNAAFSAGVELFCSNLARLASDRESFFSKVKAHRGLGFYNHPLYRDPANAKALKIGLSFFWRRLTQTINRQFSPQQWSILYRAKSANSQVSFYNFKKLRPPSGTDWADPFVVFLGNKYFVLFEELVHRNKKAHISCFTFDEQGKLMNDKPVVALEELHHLSYPFIFQHENTYYMLPEAATSGKVTLYKCERMPDKWGRYKNLIDEEIFDPTIIDHQGIWYLFGTKRPIPGSSPHQFLYIYFSTDLLNGEWKPHPQNPVTRDVRGARPAGKIFMRDGRLIRPSQIGAPKYGYGIRFQEIKELTPETFREEPLDEILPHWDPALLATHTFNSENGFTVIDAQYIRHIF